MEHLITQLELPQKDGCVEVDIDGTRTHRNTETAPSGYIYDPGTGTFSAPPEPEFADNKTEPTT